MILRDEIWILNDSRPGTISQSIGLAEELGIEYKIINFSYSFFAKIPNFFLSSSGLRLTKKSRQEFKNLNHFPRLIISAGRKSAPIALFLKKLAKNHNKIAQIMNPNLNLKKFDFVILPKHDKIDEKKFPNVISTIGSLTRINENLIAQEHQKFSSWFGDIKKPKIALLVGGASKKTKFEISSAEKLAKLSSKIANNMEASLFVLTSPRTDENLANAVKSNLYGNFKFFDWRKLGEENPYLAILAYADFFILTGDSVSMISQCCSTGKPVYIFEEKEISAKKHHNFQQNLIAENYAKKLLKNLAILENFLPKKLQEAKRVAGIIRNKF